MPQNVERASLRLARSGLPHWMRALANSRATLVAHFATPAHCAGIAIRPVLSVVSAIFRPSPSRGTMKAVIPPLWPSPRGTSAKTTYLTPDAGVEQQRLAFPADLGVNL